MIKREKYDVVQGVPHSELYERGYVLRSRVAFVFAVPSRSLILSVCADGRVHFWRKVFRLVELAKALKAAKESAAEISATARSISSSISASTANSMEMPPKTFAPT